MASLIIYGAVFIYALFDAQTVINGAAEGVRLATTVVIPSLFPFIFLSLLFSNGISGKPIRFLRPIEKLCGMPKGSGNLLVLGLCGGYPVGAQCIESAYRQGTLSKIEAQRLLGFCNNAGPSFIFGMVGGILKRPELCWFLWVSQILSAIIVGAVLPGKSNDTCRLRHGTPLTISQGLEQAIHVCAKISGWVILFRALISVLEQRLIAHLPVIWRTGLAGMLELSNGCIRVQELDSVRSAYLLCGIMLAFGGFCVHLQTKSVAKDLSIRYYLLGKVLQAVIIVPILLILWKIGVAF